jgi:hypothetical protein
MTCHNCGAPRKWFANWTYCTRKGCKFHKEWRFEYRRPKK